MSIEAEAAFHGRNQNAVAGAQRRIPGPVAGVRVNERYHRARHAAGVDDAVATASRFVIIDLFEEGTPRHFYDVVIVGTGPAGITVANELSGSGLSVGALESGGRTTRPLTDRLRATVSEGIEIKEHSRERVSAAPPRHGRRCHARFRPPISTARTVATDGPSTTRKPSRSIAWRRNATGSLRSRRSTTRGFDGVRARSEFAPEWELLTERLYLAPRKAPNFAAEHRDTFGREGTDAILGATAVSLEADGSGAVTSVRYRDPWGTTARSSAAESSSPAEGSRMLALLLRPRTSARMVWVISTTRLVAT